MRIIMTALLASFLFYSGMKDYVKVGKTDIAVVELYGDYPAVNLAKQIWENYQSGDEIKDFCFVWNGGVQVVTNSEDFRQTNARVTGAVGMAALYDRQAALLEENDETGCVIDKDTALELFGSEKEEMARRTRPPGWRPATRTTPPAPLFTPKKRVSPCQSMLSQYMRGDGPWFPG